MAAFGPLLRLLLQQLFQALRLLLRIPLAGQPGIPGTQLARGQFLDARRVHTHAVAHLPHQFQAAQQALHGFLLLLHLLLPLRARDGKCQQARLLHLRALQARCLRLDQVFQPVLDALDLLVLGLDLRRQCRAILHVWRGGIQHRRLLH
eukprot:gene22059-26488_t